MGREIRRVPPNWQHPESLNISGHQGKQSMYDRTFAEAAAEWKDGLAKWEKGERPEYCSDESAALEYWEWEGAPPVREYYRPWSDSEATWFQLWETVSEGTPVSPPFATREELAQYLAEHGDFWDQERCKNQRTCDLMGLKFGKPGWGIEQATAFVKAGWAPSLAIVAGQVIGPKDFPLHNSKGAE